MAREAIRKHPEMVLLEDDFAGWRINWQDKAQNIAELVAALNLGLDSVVFIDDNPAERARVREALPDVFVPEWPVDKRLYPHALKSLECFNDPRVSAEDRTRSQMYPAERHRQEAKAQVGSINEWLRTLNLTVQVQALSQANVARATQLLNKTNQMNLATRRLTEAELSSWAACEHRAVLAFSVDDRFGNSGLTGIIGLEQDCGLVRLVDFVLSCRVMGRRVEETMLHVAVTWAHRRAAVSLTAQYLPTAKNKPCLEFFRRSGLAEEEGSVFVWASRKVYPLPDTVRLIWDPVGAGASLTV